MGDDEDEVEVALDGADGVEEVLASLGVLGAEALVEEEGAEGAPARVASSLDRAMRRAKLMRKASPPLNSS